MELSMKATGAMGCMPEPEYGAGRTKINTKENLLPATRQAMENFTVTINCFLKEVLMVLPLIPLQRTCLLYTSDAADERSSVDLGGRRIIKKKKR